MPNVKLDPDKLQGTFEKRVFIGGNYDFPVTLRKIRDIVTAKGFVPVLALDFDIPPTTIHDWDLRLLHNCKFAIFEVSCPAGELMEIERAREYKTLLLLAFQARDEQQKDPPRVGTMLKTAGYEPSGYLSFEHFDTMIGGFLLGKQAESITTKGIPFTFSRVHDSYEVRKDGSVFEKHEFLGLSGAVSEIVHEFGISKGEFTSFQFNRDVKRPMKWEPDKMRSIEHYIEGKVVLEKALRQGDPPINYSFALETSAGAVCLTKEEYDAAYPQDSFPYEYVQREVVYLINELLVEVYFFPNYQVTPIPKCSFGSESLDLSTQKANFEVDEESNCAKLSVNSPCLLHTYMIYWEPLKRPTPRKGRRLVNDRRIRKKTNVR